MRPSRSSPTTRSGFLWNYDASRDQLVTLLQQWAWLAVRTSVTGPRWSNRRRPRTTGCAHLRSRPTVELARAAAEVPARSWPSGVERVRGNLACDALIRCIAEPSYARRCRGAMMVAAKSSRPCRGSIARFTNAATQTMDGRPATPRSRQVTCTPSWRKAYPMSPFLAIRSTRLISGQPVGHAYPAVCPDRHRVAGAGGVRRVMLRNTEEPLLKKLLRLSSCPTRPDTSPSSSEPGRVLPRAERSRAQGPTGLPARHTLRSRARSAIRKSGSGWASR